MGADKLENHPDLGTYEISPKILAFNRFKSQRADGMKDLEC